MKKIAAFARAEALSEGRTAGVGARPAMRCMGALVLLLIPGLCAGAIENVRVLGTTSTQAILAYTAPSNDACTIEVSESADYAPLAADVDPSKFAGANLDTRAGNVTSGRSRVVVVGKRAAERGIGGKFYSRALQADTEHFFRITCGADSAMGRFRTRNIPLGNTYPEPFPVDPDRPGEYAWPTMNQAAGNNERIIDPQTGALIKRLTGAGSYTSNTPNSNMPSLGAFDDSGALNGWSTSGEALPAVYTADGSSPPKLYVPMDPSAITSFTPKPSDDAVQMDWVTVKITGSATGGGEDAKVQFCLTIDGVSCAPDSRTAEVTLTSCGAGCVTGDSTAYMGYWFEGRMPSFNGTDVARRTTTAAYDNATGGLTWTSGHYFNPQWTAGTRVWISGVPYKISAVGGPKSMTIAPGLALTNPTVTGQAFGILAWKKTSTAGTAVTISDVRFTTGKSNGFSFWNGGNMHHCNPTPVELDGESGYYCVLYSQVFSWINRRTGDVRLLSTLVLPARLDPGGNGWNSMVAVSMSAGYAYDAADPKSFYGLVGDQNGKQIVVRVTYTGDSQNHPLINLNSTMPSTVMNLTPTLPNGYDLESLIQRFDPRYNPAQYGCLMAGSKAGVLTLSCWPGQDAVPGGWTVIFDPKITPTETDNPVIAAMPSSGVGAPNPSPARWCLLHGSGAAVPGMCGITVNPVGVGAPNYTQFATTLAQPISDATSTTVYVAGEPGGGAVDVARVGDIFRIGGENVRITAKISATQWEVSRAYGAGVDPGGSTASTHAVGTAVVGRCGAIAERGSYHIWWNYGADPHGYNASGTTVDTDTPYMGNGHAMFGLDDTFVRISESPGCSANAGSIACWQVRVGALPEAIHRPPTAYVNVYSPFAGLKPFSYGTESHPSQMQGEAPPYERQWMLDSRPIINGAFLGGSATNVTGNLYLSTKALHPKQLATYAFCGSHPLQDVSGPGSSITGGASDAYKYCIANGANECYPGSSAGQVYVNCPNLTYTSGCYGDQYREGHNVEDICVGDGISGFGSPVVQLGVQKTDRYARYTRVLTHGFGRYRRQPEAYWSNGKALPDASWALFTSRWVDNQRSDIYSVKLPPFPPLDSTVRGTFTPVAIRLGSVPAGTDNVTAEFGYNPDLYCGSRRETCVANAGAVNESSPFFWASETYSGLPCASGCTVAIPAIGNRVLYYRIQYRGADGAVISRGPIQIVAVP